MLRDSDASVEFLFRLVQDCSFVTLPEEFSGSSMPRSGCRLIRLMKKLNPLEEDTLSHSSIRSPRVGCCHESIPDCS